MQYDAPVHNEWIADRQAEFVELKSDPLGRVHRDSEHSGNPPLRSSGYEMGERKSGFFGECSLPFFRKVMADYFQGKVSIVRNIRLRIVDSTHSR